jgi:hypothetical protein
MYQVSDGLRSTRNHDGAVVLDIPHGQILHLNPTGFLILTRLQQGQTEMQIIHEIGCHFGVPIEIVQTDVTEFMEALKRHKLLQGDCSARLP